MANNENEPAKLLLPYLQRADELQKHEPLVAYYCRLYAMERGLKIPQSERTKTTNAILISLMKQLEKDKKSLKLVPDDSLYLEGFASSVFSKADKQDRAGRADWNTAKTFYAASIFFEILNQFGEVQPDIEQKQKYAAWKAVDIRKALKEGRKPEPGPPIDDEDLSLLSSTTSDAYEFEPRKSATDSEPQPDRSPRVSDETNHQHLSGSTQSLPSYPSQDFQPPPQSKDISEKPSYSQGYHHQTYPQEHPPHFPQEHHQNFPQDPHQNFPQEHHQNFPQDSHQNFPQDSHQNFPQEHHQHFPQESHQQFPLKYPSHEISSVHSLPNFQSYPSFSDSSLPAAPTHYPYTQDSSPHAPNYPSAPQYSLSNNRNNETVSLPAPNPAPTFQYDSNYLPAPEKIVEAHKAARFAVGALAFDDVPIAIDFLKKSLELLTNPTAGQ